MKRKQRTGARCPCYGHAYGTPCAFVYSENTDVLATMNSRLRYLPPNVRFAQRSGKSMRPMSFPPGLKIDTPSSPSPVPQPHHRLPSTSHRNPSAEPFSSAVTAARLLASFVPSSTTSYALIVRGVPPPSTTYRIFSSGENVSPFGRLMSVITAVTLPSFGSTRYTFVGSSGLAT